MLASTCLYSLYDWLNFLLELCAVNVRVCHLQYFVLCRLQYFVLCHLQYFMLYVCHLQYFVLVVLIFIMEIVAGVLAFVYRRDIETFLSKELVAGIRQHYPSESEPDPEGLRAAWGFIQTEVRLCALLTNHACNFGIFFKHQIASGFCPIPWHVIIH